MKAVTLIENTAKENFYAEHGLSLYIEYRGKKILLDGGQSDRFWKNAEQMGIDLKQTEISVLSHAHYDHGDGLEIFLEKNSQAVLYVNKNAGENCYGGEDFHYIGLKPGFLKKFGPRIRRVDGKYKIAEGIFLLAHSTPGLEKTGLENKLYRKEKNVLTGDNFNHEQSLILEVKQGLVIFNSCSHSGADVILDEVQKEFPGEKVYAFFGGLHLSKWQEKEVQAYGEKLKKYNVERIITGHCTGEEACRILEKVLGSSVERMTSGKVIEIEE